MKLYSRLALITSLTLVTGYAFVYAYTNLTLSDADSGKSLTSTLMQTIMGNVNELNTRVNSLASGWGNLWGTGASNSINYTAGTVGIGSTAGTNAELQIKSGTKPHWGIYQDETSEELRFWNGSNRVVFGSGGNVGIGVAPSTTQRVRIGGNIQVSNTYKIGWHDGVSAGGIANYITGDDTTNHLSLGTNNLERIRIDSNGNVGIGTPNPEGKLDTYGAGYFGFQDYRTQAVQKVLVLRAEPISGSYSQSRFNFYTTPGTTANGVSKLTIKSQYAADAESTELFTLAGDGNVGIGTPSPIALIHGSKVIANSSSSIRIENYSLAAGANANFQASSKDTDGTLRTWYMGVGSSSLIGGTKQNYLGFWNTSDYGNAKVVIDYAGSVGIGTPSPGVKLHVLWNNEMARFETTSGGANQYAQIGLMAPGAANYIWTNNNNSPWFYGGNSALNIYTGQDSPIAFFTNGNYQRMTIAGNGNVMINTTTDAGYKLDVNGSVRGTSWTNSDRNLKKNIETLPNGLEKILAIRGVTYDWKDPSKGIGSQVGVIAQEVEQIFPELVNTDKQGMKAVNYAALVAPLIEAVKEQQKQISTLQAKVQALENGR